MFVRILLFLILVPFVEWNAFKQVYRLLKVEWGSSMAIQIIILALVVIAFLGIKLIKKQGARIMQSLRQGVSPSDAALSGGVLVVSGVLLLIPGFVTDALAFLLMTPPMRSLLKKRLQNQFAKGMGGRNFSFFYTGGGPFGSHQQYQRTERDTPRQNQHLDNVIDVDAIES